MMMNSGIFLNSEYMVMYLLYLSSWAFGIWSLNVLMRSIIANLFILIQLKLDLECFWDKSLFFIQCHLIPAEENRFFFKQNLENKVWIFYSVLNNICFYLTQPVMERYYLWPLRLPRALSSWGSKLRNDFQKWCF